MTHYPPSVLKLIKHLARLPGIVGYTCGDQFVEHGFGAGIRVFATHPDSQLSVLWIVDLHGRAWWETRAATNAFFLIHFQTGFAVDHGRANGCHRATRHYGWTFAHVGHQVMVDLRRFGVLHVDSDITLTAAVDLAARSGDVNPVGHSFSNVFVVQFVH